MSLLSVAFPDVGGRLCTLHLSNENKCHTQGIWTEGTEGGERWDLVWLSLSLAESVSAECDPAEPGAQSPSPWVGD